MIGNRLTRVSIVLLFALAGPAAAAADGGETAAAAQPSVGLRKTVAVDLFQAAESVGGTVTAEGMTAMLTAALARDGRFVVVERTGLGGVLNEQQLARDGGTTAETGAQGGQLIGASAIIRASVTKFEANASGSGAGISGLPLGRLLGGRAGVKSQKAMMEISLRLIDTSTGEVIATSTAQGTASSSSADVSLDNKWTGESIDAGTFRNTPIGQAGEQAIGKAVELIAAGMSKVPWSAIVVESAADKVYINAGADRNVHQGMTLNVYRKGKVFTDPATGQVLDMELDTIGVIRIDAVREKLSTATLVSGVAPERGDILRLD